MEGGSGMEINGQLVEWGAGGGGMGMGGMEKGGKRAAGEGGQRRETGTRSGVAEGGGPRRE